ncbi:MAG TPA: MotA/TolQ/ExbB proton channel family protein [Polyangiaceae bacterium]
MIEQSKRLMVDVGPSWVLWLLIVLSILSLAVALDRWRVFRSQPRQVDALVQHLHRLLEAGNIDHARRELSNARGVAAEIVLAGLAQWERGASAAGEAMAAATGLKRAQLERRLIVLGTVGNNAPFVGLLGTVIGIVGAFDELGKAGRAAATAAELAPERVMAPIAEALVVTAVGLVVAIPAVALFNYFQDRLLATLADAETLGHVLLAHVGAAPEAEPAFDEAAHGS